MIWNFQQTWQEIDFRNLKIIKIHNVNLKCRNEIKVELTILIPSLSLPTVLVRVVIAMMKHHDKKHIRKQRVYLYYSFSSLSTKLSGQELENRTGNWRQKLMQSQGEVLSIDLFFITCLPVFLQNPAPPVLGGLKQMEQILIHQ